MSRRGAAASAAALGCAAALLAGAPMRANAPRPQRAAGAPVPATPGTSTPAELPAGVTDASGVIQLPDGRLLIIGDDAKHPFAIVDLFGARPVVLIGAPPVKQALGGASIKALNDLEGLTRDARGRIYAATSHSRTSEGVTKADRQVLVRFELDGDRPADMRTFTRLPAALAALDPIFDVAMRTKDPESASAMNIEGLAWDPVRNRLLLGFRSPRRHHQALVVWLENPDAVFDRGAAPRLSVPAGLALDGEGIRDAAYVPALGGFVLVAGSSRPHKHGPGALWLWKGGADAPVKLPLPGLEDMNPEGVTEASSPAGPVLVLVSDDGTSQRNHYLVVPLSRWTGRE